MISYAGIDLGQYIDLINIEEELLPERVNYSLNIPSMTGELYNGFKYGKRKISIEFFVKETQDINYLQMIEDIKGILDVDAPSRLYLSGDKFYYAVIEDTTVIGQITRGVGKGILTFICYNPISYSDQEQLFTGTNRVVAQNNGSYKAFPTIDVSFGSNATFAQITNVRNGKSVLVGEWPDVNKPTAPAKGNVINDECKTLTDWLAVGNVLDEGRRIDGNFKINTGGYAITPSSFGTWKEGDKWFGPARRRNLGRDIKDFEVVVSFEFDSKGKNASDSSTTPPTNPETGQNFYKTTANLNVRSGRGTSHKILTTMPKGYQAVVTEISGGWGKVTYRGQTGYSSMKYLQLIQTTTATHRIDTGGPGLNLRAGRNTSSKIYLSIPNGTQVAVSDIQSGWGKTTYKGYTGYISMRYAAPLGKNTSILVQENSYNIRTTETADDKVGLNELYLFDNSGNKLAKMALTDTNPYFENTYPEIQIGSQVVIKDETLKEPNKETIKSDKGEDEVVNALSGKLGKWNEFSGEMRIKRRTVNGKQLWDVRVDKIVGGKVVASLSKEGMSNSNFPQGNLNNLVVYMAQNGKSPTPAMTITHVRVEQLNDVPPVVIPQLFRAGDSISINLEQNIVYLNSIPIMEHVSYDSEMFELEVGETEIRIFSDDKSIYTSVGFNERWL